MRFIYFFRRACAPERQRWRQATLQEPSQNEAGLTPSSAPTPPFPLQGRSSLLSRPDRPLRPVYAGELSGARLSRKKAPARACGIGGRSRAQGQGAATRGRATSFPAQSEGRAHAPTSVSFLISQRCLLPYFAQRRSSTAAPQAEGLGPGTKGPRAPFNGDASSSVPKPTRQAQCLHVSPAQMSPGL